jgi:hypothetical protein
MMNRDLEEWRNFIDNSAYRRVFRNRRLQHGDFWEDYRIYDQVLQYSEFPGAIVQRLRELTVPGSLYFT